MHFSDDPNGFKKLCFALETGPFSLFIKEHSIVKFFWKLKVIMYEDTCFSGQQRYIAKLELDYLQTKHTQQSWANTCACLYVHICVVMIKC